MFSLNATVPVFLVMVIGYFLRRIGILDDHFVTVSNRFNFKVTLPVLLFLDMANTDLGATFDGKLVLFCAGVTTVAFFSIWGLTRAFLKDRSMRGAFVQASYRCSVAVMGVALMQNIYGDAGPAPMMILGAVPLFNIYAVLVLTVEGPEGEGRGKLVRTVFNVVTNPLLIAIVLGTLSALLRLQYPPIVSKTLDSVASLATPQALVCIGAGFEGKKALAKVKPTAAAALIKLVLLPAIFLPLAVAMGFRDGALVTIVIMLGTATTPSSYVMAQSMGGDGVLTSSVIVSTTLLSALTLTFWLFLVRFLGLVA